MSYEEQIAGQQYRPMKMFPLEKAKSFFLSLSLFILQPPFVWALLGFVYERVLLLFVQNNGQSLGLSETPVLVEAAE